MMIAAGALSGCEQFPRHYVALNQCISEQSSVGEDHLIAYAELEDWLLEQELLAAADKASYASLLAGVASGGTDIRAYDVAPEVRDFWALQEGGSFGAFFSCAETLRGELNENQAASIHGMQRVFEQMQPAGDVGAQPDYRNPELLDRLATEAITDEDFEFVLYRASLLNLLVYMMD